MSTGTSMAFSAILIPQLNDSTSEIVLQNSEKAWITSVYSLLGIPGSIIGGFLMAKYGRIFTLKLSSIFNLLSWVAIALSQNVYWLVFGRVLSGLSTGS